jgi:hypothetical protein
MSVKQVLKEVVEQMSEDEARQVLTFARFIADRYDHEEWMKLSLQGLAGAYVDDEPEYPLEAVREAAE